MSDQQALVSVIIVSYNSADVLPACIQSLQNFTQSTPYELIVVDNASTDGSADLIEQGFPDIHLIRQSQNVGFGAGNNLGNAIAQGDFLLFLNPDTVLTEDILPHLLTIMQHNPSIGIVGPKLLNLDGTVQLSTAPAISIKGEFLAVRRIQNCQQEAGRSQVEQSFEQTQIVDIVVGAAFLIRRQLFDILNGFDERFFMYFEESDLCQRARDLGWKVLYTPDVSLVHIRGHSSDQIAEIIRLEYRKSQLYYYTKHRPFWEQIVLRVYLLIKFGILWITSLDPVAFKVMTAVLNLKRYSLSLFKH